MERGRFLSSLAATALAPSLVGVSANEAVLMQPLERALVLSGGGARGAYEAGIVGALAAGAGAADGSPIPGYEMVAGTSIGAVNGWFAATGQYSRLRELWYGISQENPIRLKPQFAALRDPQSGALDRAAAALRFIRLMRDVKGIFQSEPANEWIARHIDPATPLLVPLVWAATNLMEQRPEYFFLLPRNGGAELQRTVTRALHAALGAQTVVREATPDLLHRAIFASNAIPIGFDPVVMPDSNGNLAAYCDGGVASNSPVGIAHAIAKAADVVLLEPPFEPETTYQDAVEIAFGAYATMQRKILEEEMRSAYFQNEQLAFLSSTLPETELRYIRPQKALPLGLVRFDDEVGVGKAYRQGWEDVARGFTPYDWRTFEL